MSWDAHDTARQLFVSDGIAVLAQRLVLYNELKIALYNYIILYFVYYDFITFITVKEIFLGRYLSNKNYWINLS